MELNFKQLENKFGTSAHLLVRRGPHDKYRFASDSDSDVYLSQGGLPVFYNSVDQFFCLALHYTIIYPKIYVKKYKQMTSKKEIVRTYIQ